MSPGGIFNIVQPAPCIVAEVSDRLVEMKHERTRLLLDRETGGLLMLGEGWANVNPGEPTPLFSIDFKLPGERRVVRVDPQSVTEIIAEYDDSRGWLWRPQEPQEVITAPRSSIGGTFASIPAMAVSPVGSTVALVGATADDEPGSSRPIAGCPSHRGSARTHDTCSRPPPRGKARTR